jgi:hypothetical protein
VLTRLAALGAACAIALAAAGQVYATAPTPARSISHLTAVQAAYLTHCGGCHGIEGVSAPHSVPTLRGLAGSFLCTDEGRAYVIRLPDVALTGLSNQLLASVANFVVFDLGAPAAGGSRARPYTPAEVAQLRARPLTGPGLRNYRAAVIQQLAARCPVPSGLRAYDE